ncbi:hypothetical protein TIFTF001_027918, partial [Ficus carica]
RLRSH